MMRDMQKVVLLELADDSITEIVRQNVAMLTMIAASVTKSPKEVDPSVHVQNYAEETVPRYTTWQFHQHFRMFPDTFEVSTFSLRLFNTFPCSGFLLTIPV